MLAVCAANAQNLLRNGSFEGGLRYWYGAGEANCARMEEKRGAFLRVNDGFIWSGCFQLAPGSRVTIAADVRAATAEGKVHFYLVPNSRACGVEPFKLFFGNSGVGREVREREWTRAHWTLDIPDENFAWENPHWWDRKGWMLFISGKALDIDAVTLTVDDLGIDQYVGESVVEVAVTARLQGDPMQHWNLLEPGVALELASTLHNPGPEPRTVSWIHAVTDYTGARVLKGIPGGSATLAPGETRVEKWRTEFPGKGLMLARTRVLDSNGAIAGSSDLPVTVLAFPKTVLKKPNPDERFGYSLNDVGKPPWTPVYDTLSKVGFAWSRWHPSSAWNSVQPDNAGQWNWPDAVLDDLASRGCSYNVVLGGLPGWARGTSPVLPRDMEDWRADDPRWQDLGIATAWDTFVDAAVKRWGNGKRSVVWEILNEPAWEPWNPVLYTRFIERTARRIRAIDPKARIMVNGCYGVDDLHKGFLANGGAKSVDIFSFHNYAHGGWFTTGDAVRGMAGAFKAGGRDIEVWFNEGWTHWPSSDDTRAWSVFAERSPAQVAHETLCCVADAISGGLEKIIMFNTARNGPTRSWWDYNGDGNIIWDEGGNATVAVGLFNVMADQLGLATPVGVVRPRGAQIHVFHDRRNNRGVAVVWADAGGKALTLATTGLMRMDIMGNTVPLAARDGNSLLNLEDAGRPWYVFKPGLSGAALLALLKPHDASGAMMGGGEYGLPTDWAARGAEGNPYLQNNTPVWRLGRVWPFDLNQAGAYTALPEWSPADTCWRDPANSQGGHPSVKLAGGVTLSSVTSWGDAKENKPVTLAFIAPENGTYELDAIAHSARWTGDGAVWIHPVILDRTARTAKPLDRVMLADRANTPVKTSATLTKGQELVLVVGIDGLFTGAECRLDSLLVKRRVGGVDPTRPQQAGANK